jgi:hypothetical protein
MMVTVFKTLLEKATNHLNQFGSDASFGTPGMASILDFSMEWKFEEKSTVIRKSYRPSGSHSVSYYFPFQERRINSTLNGRP